MRHVGVPVAPEFAPERPRVRWIRHVRQVGRDVQVGPVLAAVQLHGQPARLDHVVRRGHRRPLVHRGREVRDHRHRAVCGHEGCEQGQRLPQRYVDQSLQVQQGEARAVPGRDHVGLLVGGVHFGAQLLVLGAAALAAPCAHVGEVAPGLLERDLGDLDQPLRVDRVVVGPPHLVASARRRSRARWPARPGWRPVPCSGQRRPCRSTTGVVAP